MKKMFIMVLCFAAILVLVACGEQSDAQNIQSQVKENTGKVLIAYFSVPEDVDTEGVDAISGASVVVKEGEMIGNTQYVAQIIHEMIGGDVFRIETVNDYPREHEALLDYASEEKSISERPELAQQVENFEQYDVILLGYPNWWYDMPMPIYSFLESYDFSGKTIIPFVTHGGSRASSTIETIGELAVGATIYEEPLILSRNDVADSESAIKEWAESLGINALEGTEEINRTISLALPTPGEKQTIYLWEEGKMPAPRSYSEDSGYSDSPDFMPYMEYYPAQGETKGAVLICPGGAFIFRSMYPEGYAIAERLSELGYQSFVVSYRLRPYTQEEGALDLARAVRYVRYYAEEYGIAEEDIAVVGFSAGGILCGEMILNWKGTVSPVLLDENYIPDDLDKISADAAAIGHIYSFYGRLSVGSTDVDKFKESNLPPTFYAYGTEDPFYNQFMANADAVRKAGVEVEEHCYEGQPHGFGAGNENSNWVPEFDSFLSEIFENN